MEIVTRTEKGVVSGYKVVLIDENKRENTRLNLLIYSSETGLWSLNTFHLPYPWCSRGKKISLNGNLHWIVMNNDRHDEVVSIDFYAAGTASDRCRVTPFPDFDKTTSFRKACSTSQGFLMYMSRVTSLEDKLRVWRLHTDGWQLVSEISPAFLSTGVNCFPLAVNPSDAKTAYFWSKEQQGLISVNLHNGKFVLHNQLEHIRNDGRIMISVKYMKCMEHSDISSSLPRWLHQIPNTVTRV